MQVSRLMSNGCLDVASIQNNLDDFLFRVILQMKMGFYGKWAKRRAWAKSVSLQDASGT
ncbi:hypothetical protein Nmel_012819 [Mimus melanotis]